MIEFRQSDLLKIANMKMPFGRYKNRALIDLAPYALFRKASTHPQRKACTKPAQRPIKRALERDDKRIRKWVKNDFPDIKKNPQLITISQFFPYMPNEQFFNTLV
jgi:hypothetical protein